MANTYYVNNVTGKMANSGLSTSSALPSITSAIAKVNAGDTIEVMAPGTNPAVYHEQIAILKSGTATAPITIKNYSGHTPWVDGLATDAGTGLPQGDWTLYNPSYIEWKAGNEISQANTRNFVYITGNYIVWDGVNIRGSLGRGLCINTADYVTVKNCTIGPNYQSNILITGGATYCTIDNVDIKGSGSYYPLRRATESSSDGCAAMTFQSAHHCTIKNSRLYNNWGETLICDANWGRSTYTTIEDNVMWDNMKASYLHGTNYVTFQRNFIFRTDTEIRQKTYNAGTVPGVQVSAIENNRFSDRDKTSNHIDIINNIFRGVGVAISIKGSENRSVIDDILVANNTVVYCDVGASLVVTNKTNCVFKNNIFYGNTTDITDGTAGFVKIGAHGSSNWTIDYNHWESAVHANATGANDVIGDPGLVDWDFAIPTAAKRDPTKYRLTSGSDARAAANDLSATFDTDFNSDTRSDWDMGAYEYDGNSAPTATNSPDDDTGTAPHTVVFTGGPGGMTSYAWDFGDGKTAATQSPTHVYQSAGSYTATLTVTDSNGLTDWASATITVHPVGSGELPFLIEVVELQAGDATYTVTGANAPAAALFFYSNGITNAAAANNAVMGFGMAVGADLATQYALGVHAEHNQGTTDSGRGAVDDYAIMFPNSNGQAVLTGTITSATETTVSLTWDGTDANERIIAWNFSGNAVTNTTAGLIQTKVENGESTIAGDWNLAIMPFIAQSADSWQAASSLSFGFAKRDGNQVCVAYHNRDNQATTDIRSETFSDRIAHTFRYNYGLQISSWTSSGITVKTIDDDGYGEEVPILLMKISGYDFNVEIEQTPTATGNNDYTTNYGYDPQAVLGIITNHAQTDTLYTSTNAGVFGLFSIDSVSVDRTVAITSKDNVATSVEKSYTDAKFVTLTEATAVVTDATASVITGGFRINPAATVSSTAYQMPVLVIEKSATGTGIVAAFTHDADEFTTPDDTIQFTDLTDGASSWDWDWGDGTAHGTTQNPTHQYASTGTYNVILAIDGGGGLLTTEPQALTIISAPLTISYTITPTSGTVPLTITLDATGSTPATGREIDHEKTGWGIHEKDALSEYESNIYYAFGSEATLVIDEPGTYSVYLSMFHTNNDIGYAVVEDEDVIVVSIGPYTADFYNADGQVTLVGPYDAVFTPIIDRIDRIDGSYAWDFGDTNTDTLGFEDAENTYAAVLTRTEYDVELVVTWPDGTTDTITKEDYITIVPTPVAPRTIDEMMTRLATLETVADSVREHLGIIDGTWTRHATYTNVYQITLSRIWVTGMTLEIVENGAALASAISVAAANGVAGSYYVDFSTPNLTIFVRTTNTDNPGLNGKAYRFQEV